MVIHDYICFGLGPRIDTRLRLDDTYKEADYTSDDDLSSYDEVSLLPKTRVPAYLIV